MTAALVSQFCNAMGCAMETANLTTQKKGRHTIAADRVTCAQYVVALALCKGGVPAAHDVQDAIKSSPGCLQGMFKGWTQVPGGEMWTCDAEKQSVVAGVTIVLAKVEVLEEVLIGFPVGLVNSKKNSLPKVR